MNDNDNRDSPTPTRKLNKEKVKETMLQKWFLPFSVVVCIMSIFFYQILTTCPEQPAIDFQEFWGPYPIDTIQDNTIKPYNIEFPDMIVNDLKERLLHRRPFSPPLENMGFQFGFNTDFITRVLDFWQSNYNFKERERFLNKYSHYMTKIQGLDIHYIHVKPNAPAGVDVIPILLIHNFPSSIREFYELIPMLTTPSPDQEFVFEVIAPSLPGFGFSQAPARPGMGAIQVSVVLHNLMKRIGHEKYYIHGGGLGFSIGTIMATILPDNVLGFHCNIPLTFGNPSMVLRAAEGLLAPSSFFTKLENHIYPENDENLEWYPETDVLLSHSTRPDTIGIGLTESPAGLTAYILESWTNPKFYNATDGGLLNKFSLTHLMDNVMIYWVTNSITTSIRQSAGFDQQIDILYEFGTKVPTCGMRFNYGGLDLSFASKYLNYLRSTYVEEGGQFPAMELPKILADDMYDAMKLFRKFTPKSNSWWYNLRSMMMCQFKQEIKRESPPQPTNPEPVARKTVYDFIVKDIHGKEISLDIYKGKVLIIVNVASQCGYTDTHYTQLNELYVKYYEKGLRILAFPCNQFGSQEPGSLGEILKFTQKRNVKFDVFEKIEVNGENTHPLWQFLKEAQSGTLGDFIKWNFSKFIVDRNGVPVERFGPNVGPLELEPYLTKYF